MEIKVIKGTNQIGGCITEIKSNKGTRILIDFGKDLDDENNLSDNYEIEGLTYKTPAYDAVFITHSHGDHIGLVYKIIDSIPIYIDEKSLLIHNIMCDFVKNMEKINGNVITFKVLEEKEIIINDDIKVTPFFADHSAYNACMFLIEVDGKKVLHTGDFRMHGIRKDKFIESIEKIGEVDVLITEGTTLSRVNSKYKTEEELEETAKNLFSQYDQILIMQSSTNIDRLQTFYNARGNKNFVIDTFTQAINKILDSKLTVGNKSIYLWHPNVYKYKPDSFKNIYMTEHSNCDFLPNFIITIKQSMIYEIRKMIKYKMINPSKCLFIYSMWDGYIEKEKELNNFIEELKSTGITFKILHTSGHADIEALKTLAFKVNPKTTYVIHTENNLEGKNIFPNYKYIEENKYISIK